MWRLSGKKDVAVVREERCSGSRLSGKEDVAVVREERCSGSRLSGKEDEAVVREGRLSSFWGIYSSSIQIIRSSFSPNVMKRIGFRKIVDIKKMLNSINRFNAFAPFLVMDLKA